MIDQQLINMIDDPDPQVRTQAVKQLAKTKSQEAVQYLAAMYKTDSDPEIRELARKAGLYIKKKQREEQWTGGDGDPDAYDEPEDMPEEINVSPRAVESSKGLMDSAMNLHVAGDDDKAGEYVEKAFLTNPNLQHDSYYLGLASTVLGIPGEQVVEVLLGDVEYTSSGKAKRKRKLKPGEDEITTEKVIIDLVIFWVVMAAILIIGTLIQFQLFSSMFEGLLNSPELTAGLSAEEIAEAQGQIGMFLNVFLGAGLVTTVIWSAISSVFSVIFLLIQYALFHFTATTILGGDGSFKGLIHRVTNFYTISYAIYAIVAYFILFLVVDSLAVLMEDGTTKGGGILSTLYLISFVSSFVWIYLLSKRIGANYDFGAGKGCLTMIISYILVFAFMCACSFAFSAAIGQMFSSVMMASG